jgi:DNA-binding transcriptional regulator GbsR (MarR family)
MFHTTQVLMAARYSRSQIRAMRKLREVNEVKQEARVAARKRLFPAPEAQWFRKSKFNEIVEAQKVKEYWKQNQETQQQ